MSASKGEGGLGKVKLVREVARILLYQSVPIADKGEGVKYSENLAEVFYGRPLIQFPHYKLTHPIRRVVFHRGVFHNSPDTVTCP